MSESSKVKSWAVKNGVTVTIGEWNGAVELRAPATKCFAVNDAHTLTIASESANATWKNLLAAIRQGLDDCPVVCDCRSAGAASLPPALPEVPPEAVPPLQESRATVTHPESSGNRETWLTTLAGRLRPMIEAAGGTLPPSLKLACGWPSKGALSSKQRRIGECWQPVASSGGVTELFISPALYKGMDVAETVVHELIHATGAFKHTGSFKKMALAIGLTGKMTATVAGDDLKRRLNDILDTLPPYPHSALNALAGKEKKDGTRLLKVMCPDEGCGYVVRVTQKWIDVGYPVCPCGETMGQEGQTTEQEEEIEH